MIKDTKLYQIISPFHSEIFFMAGFLFDVLTAGSASEFSFVLTSILYLSIAALYLSASKLLNIVESKISNNYNDDIIQFCLGALLSVLTIFFFKSSSFSNSFWFLITIVSIMFVNELKIKNVKLSSKLDLDLNYVIFSISLISIVYILSTLIFSRANFFILLFAMIITFGVYRLIIKKNLRSVLFALALYFFAYVTKALPPIPFVVTSDGIYSSLVKSNGSYIVTSHERSFFDKLTSRYNLTSEDSLIYFFNIFSPAGFNQDVFVTVYKYLDGEYKKSDRIKVSTIGGRREGFRGYVRKKKFGEGSWRIVVELSSGLIVSEKDLKIDLIKESQGIERITL